MADEATDGALHCANCGVPIIHTEYMVEIVGRYYPCASCAWVARHPDRVQRLQRGGGMVQTCHLCHAPIVFSEIMVLQDGHTYCCPNNAAVARAGGAVAAPPVVSTAPGLPT